MIIRSQDKRAIINVETVKHVKVEPLGERTDFTSNGLEYIKPHSWLFVCDGIEIAKYSSEEEALKIMDRLENCWGNVHCFQMPKNDSLVNSL